MTIRIPQSGVISQPNKGDIFGSLYYSQNLDTRTNPGKFRASPRLKVAIKDDDTDISNMGVPLAFVMHDKSSTKQYYAVCGVASGFNSGTGAIIVSDDSDFDSDWDNDPTSSTPTDVHADFSDAINWRDSLVVTTYSSSTSRLKRLTSAWNAAYHTTVTYTFSSAGGPKLLCEGFNGNLYVGDNDQVNYISPAGAAVQTGAGTIDFNEQYRVIWIRSSSDSIWIGLMSYDAQEGSKGFVARWNTQGTAAQQLYSVDAPCALSCEIVNNVPYIVDAFGVIKAFNGGGFVEVARLPVANTNIEMPGIYNDLTVSRWIHQRGLSVSDDGKLLINVNNFVSTGVYVQDMPSGVWEFDPKNPQNGVHHRNSPCADSNDHGQQLIATAGAILGAKRTEGNFIAGYGYYTDNATTQRNGIFYDDVQANTDKRAVLVLPFVMSSEIKETWQKLNTRHTPLPSGDKIITKSRTRKSANFPFVAGITWASATQFTSTSSSFANVTEGDECQFVMGKHSGTTAHVSSISEGGGTYTVNLDESVGSSSGSGKVMMTNFKKSTSFSQQDQDEHDSPITASSVKVQVKAELRFSGDTEVDDFTIISTENKKLG